MNTPRSRAVARTASPFIRQAAAPAPTPHEPEPVPVLPSPEVDLPPVSVPQPGPSRPNYGQFLVAGENVEDFLELTVGLLDHYHPATAHEHSLLEDLAGARWFLLRRQRAIQAMEAQLFANQPEASAWSEADIQRLAEAGRYREQAERTFQRALRRVKAFCAERVARYRWEATYDLAVRQFELEKKKLEHKTTHRAKKMEIAA